ncbi:hypothetical protein C8J56DRAFT_884203 [Mycena floridula]|nr:hypothetical protein C8J56DRAFT_884203 [Mycena floridula]
MNFMSLYNLFFLLLGGLGYLTTANAFPLEQRDVFVPPVTYPHANAVWKVGEHHHVTWDASNPPKQITNGQGLIMLRKAGLATPLILANGFDILLGKIEVTVPFVLNGSDYQIILFGDSGNFSPTFTISSPVAF